MSASEPVPIRPRFAAAHWRARIAQACAAATLGCCLAAVAQPSVNGASRRPSPEITQADMDRARQAQPTVSDRDIEEAKRRHLPASDGLSRPDPAAAAAPGVVRVDALPQPAAQTPVDLSRLAAGYEAMVDTSQANAFNQDPGLLIFVSLTMPRPTLERLVSQAERARAGIFLRGFAGGSLRDTVAQVQSLIGRRQVAIQIDPQAFDRYGIARVPSFVLARDGARPASCASGTCPPPGDHLQVSGDVSLDHALEHMQRAVPGFSRDAAVFLQRLKATPN